MTKDRDSEMGSRDNMRISSPPYTSPGPGFPDMPVPTWLVGPYLAELWEEAIQPLRVTLSLHPLSSPPSNLFCSLFAPFSLSCVSPAVPGPGKSH